MQRRIPLFLAFLNKLGAFLLERKLAVTSNNAEGPRVVRVMTTCLLLATSFVSPTISAAAAAAPKTSPIDCEAIYQAPGHGEWFYEENPTYFDPRNETGALPSAKPEKHHLNHEHLQEGVAKLRESDRSLSVIVVKGGDIILEEYFNGSGRNHSNNVHSASKSIMSTLVGIAIDRGDIKSVDQPLSDFFPEYFSDTDNKFKQSLTVRHLLTMSAGFEWRHDPVRGTEIEIQSQPDWVNAILSLPITNRPGQKFFYNTGLTHLMSALISRATDMSTCRFAHDFLLEPIGITTEHWGRDPQGVYSGGYNFYITPREMATFGQLILNGGSLNGQQLVPREWIRESATPHFTPSRGSNASWWSKNRVGHGYNWWLLRINDQAVLSAWGWGGQMIYVIPELDTVVVLTKDTSDAKAVAKDPVNHDFVRDYILK